ncbi:MAG: hypothetical protein RL711_1315 [Bacteroidota bacterium]|jgi:1-phosphofructokinase family hexose kinase
MSKYNNFGQYILVVCPNPAVDIYAKIDSFKQGGTNRIVEETQFPGGKGVHVAMAAAELGEKVVLLGFWGGPTGSWIKKEIEERFPSIQCVGPEVTGWTRCCYTFKSNSDFDDAELLGTGPTLTENNIEAFQDTFEKYINNSTCVCLSGSWPKGAPQNGYANMIKVAKANHKATFLDCTGVQFENAIKMKPYMVHLNKKEVCEAYGVNDIKEAIAQLVKTCDYAAVTDGAKGLYLADSTSLIQASCTLEKDKIYSAVGCGDCLTAGLVVAYVRNLNNDALAKMAVACGSANCLRKDLGMLYAQDVAMLLEQAIIV